MASHHIVTKVSVTSLVSALAILSGAVFAFASTTSALLPNADGTYKQWTPSSGTVHYTRVSESACDGNTTYNATSIVGNRDSYAVDLSSVPAGSTITQIDISPCASRNASGGANPIMNVFYRYNGGNSPDSGSYSLSGTSPVTLPTTTYSGLSIVTTASSTLEIGAVLTSGTKGARLSRVSTMITYTSQTPPSAPTNLQQSTFIGTSTTQVTLGWTDTSSNETFFSIERALGTSTFSVIATSSANTAIYIDSPTSGSYSYRVNAVNSYGSSGYTNIATTTIP